MINDMFWSVKEGKFMFDIMAQHLTDVIYKYCELEPAKRSVYTYGFQLSLSTLGSMTSIFMMALAFGNLYSAVAFLGVFFVLRIFSGGYHAPTYARCFVLTKQISPLKFHHLPRGVIGCY